MENKRAVPVWVSVLIVVLCITSIAIMIYLLPRAFELSALVTFMSVAAILADAMALVYCIGGYKKSSAVFFNLFCYLNVLCMTIYLLIKLVYFDDSASAVLVFLLALVEMAIFFVFSLAKNLGKNKSFICASALLAAGVLDGIITIVCDPLSIAGACSSILVRIVFLIMVYAKYQDKAARGTK